MIDALSLPGIDAVDRAEVAAARIALHLMHGGDLADVAVANERAELAAACHEIAVHLVEHAGMNEGDANACER